MARSGVMSPRARWAARRQEGLVQGAEIRIVVERRASRRRRRGRRRRGLRASALARVAIGGGSLSSGVTSRPTRRERDADRFLAARPGQADREDEAGDGRRHPGDERGRNQQAGDQREDAERTCDAMAPHDGLEGDRAVVAPLRIPAGVEAEQDMHDMAGLDQHHDRREQRRHDDLEQGRERRAGSRRRAPRRVGPSNRATIRPNSFGASSTAMVTSNSASERSASNRGQVGKQREVVGEIFRPDVARLQDEHDADQQLRQPQRRGEIAHDAGDEMLARGRDAAPWPAARACAADCPGTSAGRAPRGRSARAGFPRRSRRASAACRRHSRRGGSAPPRRNHGSGYGRRRAAARADAAGRNGRRRPRCG